MMGPPFAQRFSHLEGRIHTHKNKGSKSGAQLEYKPQAQLDGGIPINT